MIGRGGASGVCYKSETPATMLKQLHALQACDRAGSEPPVCAGAASPGVGARSALACALWGHLEASFPVRPAWQIAGLGKPQPVVTTFVWRGAPREDGRHRYPVIFECSRDQAQADGRAGRCRPRARRTRRAAGVWLGVDANQGFTRPFLETLLPVLVECRVDLVEQPLRVGEEAQLDGFRSAHPDCGG